jgi:hypothetical protein
MGWDVLITTDLRGRDPLDTIARIRGELERVASIGDLFSLEVKAPNYLDVAIAVRHSEHGPLAAECFEELREATEALPGARGCWEAQRCLVGKPEPWSYRVFVHALGADYRWPALARNPSPAVLDAGDYKHFTPSIRRRAAHRNLAALVDECAALVAAGASHLRGLDAEHDDDPRRAWLVFHTDPKDYREDLRRAGLPVVEIDDEALLDAALACETLSLCETARGLILYAKRGPVGGLDELYEALARTT